eukprot:TRINITY_DN1254_c0_g1_i5.p2 TRINITY_DN1254_c0_g1~~TRINITY_DN1254_c0_g1_i5.p2  ORF type:complete len:121 (+),score=28.34 TRINITY_DN1254_c0_g1_i5:1-363(+)
MQSMFMVQKQWYQRRVRELKGARRMDEILDGLGTQGTRDQNKRKPAPTTLLKRPEKRAKVAAVPESNGVLTEEEERELLYEMWVMFGGSPPSRFVHYHSKSHPRARWIGRSPCCCGCRNV